MSLTKMPLKKNVSFALNLRINCSFTFFLIKRKTGRMRSRRYFIGSGTWKFQVFYVVIYPNTSLCFSLGSFNSIN